MEAVTPLADVLAEAERITGAAIEAGVPLKLIGGAAICLHSESARRPPLKRKYGDLDFVTPAKRRGAVDRLLTTLGYLGELRFNTLNGDRRLLYLDLGNGRLLRSEHSGQLGLRHVSRLPKRTEPGTDLLV